MATAWAPIRYTESSEGDAANSVNVTKEFTCQPGDEVNKSDVGDDWDYLVAAGVIRNEPYPETTLGEAPREVIIRKAKAQMEAAQGMIRTAEGRTEPDS